MSAHKPNLLRLWSTSIVAIIAISYYRPELAGFMKTYLLPERPNMLLLVVVGLSFQLVVVIITQFILHFLWALCEAVME